MHTTWLYVISQPQVQRSGSRASFSPVQSMILHLHPECTSPQQDLKLTEANKLTYMRH